MKKIFENDVGMIKIKIERSNFPIKFTFFSILLDDKCQFWLKESTNVITSPYFSNTYGSTGTIYHHNLNCVWILEAEEGSNINIEIDYLDVKNMPKASLTIFD